MNRNEGKEKGIILLFPGALGDLGKNAPGVDRHHHRGQSPPGNGKAEAGGDRCRRVEAGWKARNDSVAQSRAEEVTRVQRSTDLTRRVITRGRQEPRAVIRAVASVRDA